jgi:hypothetical protein
MAALCTAQAVGSDDSSLLFCYINQLHHNQLTTHCLLKMTNLYTSTLKMATAMFVETLDNFQH